MEQVSQEEINSRFTTDLYFECHITVEPVFGERLDHLKNIVSKYDFRVAELLMKKRSSDTEFRSCYDTFCTGTSTLYDVLLARTQGVINELEAEKFQIWRYKIENTLLDVHIKKK